MNSEHKNKKTVNIQIASPLMDIISGWFKIYKKLKKGNTWFLFPDVQKLTNFWKVRVDIGL